MIVNRKKIKIIVSLKVYNRATFAQLTIQLTDWTAHPMLHSA
jgi:hypothetical protein